MRLTVLLAGSSLLLTIFAERILEESYGRNDFDPRNGLFNQRRDRHWTSNVNGRRAKRMVIGCMLLVGVWSMGWRRVRGR